MGLGLQMGQHLEFVAQGQGGMIRLCCQELVVETAAVAAAMALGIEGQAGHQHQRGGIVSHRLIGNGFGDIGVALFHLGQVIHEDELHDIAVALGNGHPLSVL